MWLSILLVACGGGIGSVFRWGLGYTLNSVWTHIPFGTLVANLLGGFIIGVLLGIFLRMAPNDQLWRAFLVTGFCGGFTTFSTFSAEVVALMQTGRLSWALVTILLHVCGTLLLTFAGLHLAAVWMER